MPRPFRFGVVAPITTDLQSWLDQVRRIADSGYATLLMPDFPQLQPAPGPALATAAAVSDLRVGTWVYASPLRPAWMTAWEAHSLSQAHRWPLRAGHRVRPAGNQEPASRERRGSPSPRRASGWPTSARASGCCGTSTARCVTRRWRWLSVARGPVRWRPRSRTL